MSNSFLPKKAPNLLSQETLERVLVALRQPFSIAILASLGVHGLLWAALPNFLAETEKESDAKPRIKTVELSPAEQSQLPQFGINPIPQTLLPTKPPKPAQSGTKLPDPKLYNDSSLYNFPILEPPPPILFPSSGLPPGLDFKLPPIKKTPQPKQSTDQVIKPPKPPEKPDEPKKDTDTTKTPVDSTTPARPEKLSSKQLTDLRQEGAQSSQLRTLYSFNGPDTSEKAAGAFKANAETFIDGANKVTGGNADSNRLYNNPERLAGLFPKEACPFVREIRNASLGAIVKPDGTLAEPPTVLLTTGFKGLDNAAIADVISTVKNKKYGDGSKFQLIRFDFIFDPKSACSASNKPA